MRETQKGSDIRTLDSLYLSKYNKTNASQGEEFILLFFDKMQVNALCFGLN